MRLYIYVSTSNFLPSQNATKEPISIPPRGLALNPEACLTLPLRYRVMSPSQTFPVIRNGKRGLLYSSIKQTTTLNLTDPEKYKSCHLHTK
jgi:hypothetical protein